MESTKQRFKDIRPAITITIVLFIIMVVFAGWAARQIPADARLPVHWNVNGQPDRFAGKFFGLFMMPIVVFLAGALMIFLPSIEPRQKHIRMSIKAYNFILISIVLVFAVLHIVVVMNALGIAFSIDKIVPAMTGTLFIIIGNYMGKVRSNYMLGIKTPWTLSSELSWNKTHRLGGRLFVLSGFLIVLGSLLSTGKVTMIILLCSVFGIVIVSFAYSYIIWKKDPAKQSNKVK